MALDAREIISAIETPCYVYDQVVLEANLDAFRQAFAQ